MRKRKYLVGALLSVVGALVVSGTASAAVTGQGYTVTTSPAKQDKKVFGPVGSFKNVVDTNYSGGFTPFGTQTVLTFSKDIKFTPGNIPQCNLSAINTVPQSTADAQCSASKVGTGSATINGGALTGVVAAYNGQPVGGSPTDRPAHGRARGRCLPVQHHADRCAQHQLEHADRFDPAHGNGDHALRDDDHQEEVGQEDVLRDGPLQEEEVEQLGDHDVHGRLQHHGVDDPEVQAEAEEEVGTAYC